MKNIHIIDPSQNLIDRLSVIKFKPNYVLCEGVDEKRVRALYPRISLSHKGKVDLILSLVKYLPDMDLIELFIRWRKQIKPNGIVLFVLVDVALDIRELGDVLVSQGFVNVVVDQEDGMIYGHLMGPQEIRISIDQIRRAD